MIDRTEINNCAYKLLIKIQEYEIKLNEIENGVYTSEEQKYKLIELIEEYDPFLGGCKGVNNGVLNINKNMYNYFEFYSKLISFRDKKIYIAKLKKQTKNYSSILHSMLNEAGCSSCKFGIVINKYNSYCLQDDTIQSNRWCALRKQNELIPIQIEQPVKINYSSVFKR